MRVRNPDRVRFPRLYQAFESIDEIAEVINRSRSYVNKALRNGFTAREWRLLSQYANREDLNIESEAI